MDNEAQTHVFINFIEDDRHLAWTIKDFLEYQGCKVTFEAMVGSNEADYISNAIERADFFIVCLSNKAIETIDQFHKKLREAIEKSSQYPEGGIFIIPVKLEECSSPRSLRGIAPLLWYHEETRQRLLEPIQQHPRSRGYKGQLGSSQAKAWLTTRVEMINAEDDHETFGREEILSTLGSLIKTKKRVLIHGFGGIGKTTIATELAKNYRKILWLKAGSEDEERLKAVLSGALEGGVARLEDELIEAAIENQKIDFILVDDIRRADSLPGILKVIPRNIPLIMTSRLPIKGYSFETLKLDALDEASALKLLIKASHSEKAKSGMEDLVKILCYHPFAIQIAGKVLYNYDWPPKKLITEIQKSPSDSLLKIPLNLVDESGYEKEYKSIADVLKVSISLIKGRDKVILEAFGNLFTKSASPALISFFTGYELNATKESLNSLQSSGMLEFNQVNDRDVVGRYAVHDLSYDYLRRTVSQRPLQILEACKKFVEEAEASEEDTNFALRLEEGNIIGAVELAQKTGPYSSLYADLIYLLTVKTEFFLNYFAKYGVTVGHLKQLEALAYAPLERSHYLLSKIGNFYNYYQQDYKNAQKTYEEAKYLAEALHNPHRQALLSSVIGATLHKADREKSKEYQEALLQQANQSKDRFLKCFLWANIGESIEGEKGLELFEKSLMLACEILEDSESIEPYLRNLIEDVKFTTLLGIGSRYCDLRDYENAIEYHTQAYEFANYKDNIFWMASAAHGFCIDYLSDEQWETGIEYLSKTLELYGNIVGEIEGLLTEVLDTIEQANIPWEKEEQILTSLLETAMRFGLDEIKERVEKD